MSVLFIITYILFIYSFLRIKKSNNRLNGLLWIFITIVTYMGYNSILVYLLSVLGIHSTLLLRSIIHIVLSIGMIVLSWKNKQKYYFDMADLSIVIILLYLSFLIFLFRFGINFNLDFESTDGAAHFAMAKAFMNTQIYNDSMKNIFLNLSGRGLFFSSINTGTFLELLKPITGEIALYKSFVIFEMLSFFLSGVLMYFIIRKGDYTVKTYLLTILFLVMYQLGYPLLNLLWGFHYWGLVILLISSIMVIIKEMTANKLYKSTILLLMLFIQVFSIFVTYYLYVPVVYGALGLYFLYLWKIKKELTLKRSIIYIVVILVIPFCFGLIYFDILKSYFFNFGTATNMNIDGGNYKNLLGNFIYLIPLVCYGIISEIKRKKINFITIITVLSIVFTIILFVLCMFNIMSIYYYNKIYNLLWLVNYIYLINLVYNPKKDLFMKIYLYTYVIIVLLACFRIESVIDKRKGGISNDTIIKNIGNVYDSNVDIIQNRKGLIDNDTLKLLKELKKHDEYKNERGEIPFIANYYKKIWAMQILDMSVSNRYELDPKKRIFETMWVNDIVEVKDDKSVIYFVWLPDDKNRADVHIEDYEIIYGNIKGYILKKK